MKELFSKTDMQWVRYSDYTIIESGGVRYITPVNDSIYEIYNPTDIATKIVTDILVKGKNIRDTESIEEAENIVLDFIRDYGMLGIMVDIPLNKDFADTELTFLDTTPFSTSGIMSSVDYMQQFFVKKINNKRAKQVDITADTAYALCFSVGYCEQISQIAEYITELYDVLDLSIRYKNESEAISFLLNDKLKTNIRYNLSATDKISIRYEFCSLIAVINFTLANLLAKESSPLKVCKHCETPFYSENKKSEFCSERCRNQYNVYKSRAKHSKPKTAQ